MKKIILLASAVAISILGLAPIAFADNAVLSVTPASANHNVGTVFNISASIDPAGNKVCVVKGTLNLANLSCKSITVASGIMAQTTPSCSSPNFILGIPGCATAVKNIFSVAVAGTKAGQASLAFTGVNIIGAGVTIDSSSQGGTYNMFVPQTASATSPVALEVTTEPVQPLQDITQQAATSTQANNQPSAAGQQASLLSAYSSRTIFIIVVIILVILIIAWIWLKKVKPEDEIKK